MPGDGVYITNREIYEAVIDVSKKVDRHLAQHEVRDGEKTEHREDRRTRWSIRATLAASLVAGVIGTLGLVK